MERPMTRTNNLENVRRLGDFEIVREIGRGGMGIVYESRQISLNRTVALKVLCGGLGLTSNAVQRFSREAEAAAKLHHTNIVPIYATGEEHGTHFYAMELIDGPSLDQVIRNIRKERKPRPLCASGGAQREISSKSRDLQATGPYVPESDQKRTPKSSSLSSGSLYFDNVARMVAEVGEALEHAHREGVVHRDIKPSNLLLSPSGQLSINDFGLARILEQPGMTMTGEFVGTPAYMSPEQITAGRIPTDHRTDIYSLGATLYEMLTLELPFPGSSREQVLAQIVQKEPKAPRRLDKTVPVDLETICLKCLEKDPDRRYQSAGDLAQDLRRYVNRFAILARRVGPAARLRKWVIRNPSLAVAFSVVLICIGATGWLAYQAHLTERLRAADQMKHDRELEQERRRAALDRAILASRLEDFDEARQAIREAEKLGCSAGQVRMLQGQLALYQGHHQEAIEHLTQAADLLPTSMAAWSMLAVAKSRAGKQSEYQQALSRATQLKAESSEDYLFLGHAESQLDPGRGLRSLDEAIRRRPSVLARLVRLDALRLHVLDVPSPERARDALEDARLVKQSLAGNALVLCTSLLTHFNCSRVFDEFGLADERDAALEEGWEDFRALRRFPNLPAAVLARWSFTEGTDQEATVIDDLRDVVERTGDLMAIVNYAAALYRAEKYDQAEAILSQKQGEPFIDLVRVLFLAELPDGVLRGNQLLHQIMARDLGEWDLFNSQLILRFLGRKQDAMEVSSQLLAQPDRFPPVRQGAFRQALEYCAGTRSEQDLILGAQGSRLDLSNAELSVALTALAEGDREKSRRHLQRCLATGYTDALPYSLSVLLLVRMTRDPNWPAWIKPPH
jgi:serine/threonine protein kinase